MKILALSFALVSPAFSAPQLSEKDAAEVGKERKRLFLETGRPYTEDEVTVMQANLVKELRKNMQYSPNLLGKIKRGIAIRPKGFYDETFDDVLTKFAKVEEYAHVLLPSERKSLTICKQAYLKSKTRIAKRERPVMQKEAMTIAHCLAFGRESHEQGLRSPATQKNIQKFLTDAKSLVPAKTEKDFKWGKLCYQGAALKFDLRELRIRDVCPAFIYITKNTIEQRLDGGDNKKLTLEGFEDSLELYSKIARDRAWVRVHLDPGMTMEEVIKRMQDLQKCYPKGLYPNLTRKLDEDEPTKPKVKSTLKRRPPQPVPPQQIPQA